LAELYTGKNLKKYAPELKNNFSNSFIVIIAVT